MTGQQGADLGGEAFVLFGKGEEVEQRIERKELDR
jgi:hypothetical protein